jgi:hypothetical protein
MNRSIRELRVIARRQISQAMKTPEAVECAICARPFMLRHLYRCLYCGLWFCAHDAETHFGQTVAQYQIEHPEEFLLPAS